MELSSAGRRENIEVANDSRVIVVLYTCFLTIALLSFQSAILYLISSHKSVIGVGNDKIPRGQRSGPVKLKSRTGAKQSIGRR